MIEALGVAKPLARHRCAGPSAAEQGEADAERRAGRDLHVAAREQGRAACALLLVGGQNEFHLVAGELKTPEQEMRQPRGSARDEDGLRVASVSREGEQLVRVAQ